MTKTAEQLKKETLAVVAAARALADVVRELGTVPSGHLYAQLADRIDLPTYQRLVSWLVEAGLVEEKNHLLTWTGPKE